jgi:prepilin-type N-terminal cleavage/methylation domain-containing protein/prepilin-type processing-associated H-X9-DG protein
MKGFTLIELLVVIAIIAILAGLLFPVFSRAKESAKGTSCLSNTKEIVVATLLYVDDYGGAYPQTKRRSENPAEQDSGGGIEEPDYGSVFVRIYPYAEGGTLIREEDLARHRLFACPSDGSPFGKDCFSINPDTPAVTSYLANGYFVWGLNESSISQPANTVYLTERRSMPTGGVGPYCDYLYRPWFNPSNPDAPENDMDDRVGAVATERHNAVSNMGFADGHAKGLRWTQTFALPSVNLHQVRN